ncbi:energy transducer TonB [Ferruginibacter sp.]
MKTELILKSDVLDILFENRNKEYGAYNLRKFYDNRLMKSVAVMIGFVIVLSAFTFIPKKKMVAENGMYETITTHIAEADKKPEKKEQKEKTKAIEKPVTTKKDVANIVITRDKADTVQTIDEKDKIASVTNIVPGSEGPGVIKPFDGEPGGGEKGPDVVIVKPAIDIKTPTYSPDIMPSYPGGMEALRKFLQRNLNNPKEMEEGEEVSVKVKFVVDYDGKLQSFVTVQDGGEEFNKEVVRVLKKMPNWVPGKTNGQNVSVYFTIPVKFVPAN